MVNKVDSRVALKLARHIITGRELVGVSGEGIRSMLWAVNEIRDGRYPGEPADPRSAAALLGAKASEAKAAAARANGKKGGRPRGSGKKQLAAARAAQEEKTDHGQREEK